MSVVVGLVRSGFGVLLGVAWGPVGWLWVPVMMVFGSCKEWFWDPVMSGFGSC